MNAKMYNRLVMAATALAVLGSCVNEKVVIERTVAENTIAFRIQDGSTRSSDILASGGPRASIYPLGTDANGNTFSLQETVVDLNDWQPATKGTPAYTENVASLYGAMYVGHVAAGSTESASDTEFSLVEDSSYSAGGFWEHTYPRDAVPWDKGSDLYFYLRMPTDMAGAEDMTYGPDGTISFSFTSPATAVEQQDILLASTELTYDDYKNTYKEGVTPVPVLFRHALTGIKFATSNYISGENDGTKTYITKVKFTGLKNSGTCTFSPAGTETTADDITEYTSGGSMSWDYDESTGTFEQVIVDVTSMTDEEVEAFFKEKTYEGTDFSFPDSFYANDAAFNRPSTDWNLNDKNATMTFWFIPQQITDEVEMEVTFYVQSGQRNKKGAENTVTRTIKFSDFVGSPDWKAGQLRTYVLKANEVDVEITDNLVSGEKKNLQITNLGNVPQYVRVTVVGYWADSEGNAVFGYNASSVSGDETAGYTLNDNPQYITPWQLALEKNTSTALYGEMTEFYPTTSPDEWYTGNDGYYYYVGGDDGGILGVDQAATDVLFSSYKVTTVPDIYTISQSTLKLTKVSGVHLVMDVVCQAVIAKDGNTWNEAWKDAIGYDPKN